MASVFNDIERLESPEENEKLYAARMSFGISHKLKTKSGIFVSYFEVCMVEVRCVAND